MKVICVKKNINDLTYDMCYEVEKIHNANGKVLLVAENDFGKINYYEVDSFRELTTDEKVTEDRAEKLRKIFNEKK